MRRSKALGFSLGEIRDLLIIQGENAGACVEVKDLLETKLATVREKIIELQKLEGQLGSALRKCNQALKREPALHGPKRCPVLRQMSESKSRKD